MKTIVLLFLLCAFAAAGPILSFGPPGSNLSGVPGAVVNWDLKISNDADFLLITLVEFVAPTSVGTFSDELSSGFVVIGPGQTGGGTVRYTIDPTALMGASASGDIVVTYDLFACDPNDPGCDPGSQQIGFSSVLQAPAGVTVTSAASVPEPSTLLLAGSAAGLLWLIRRKRR